MLKEMNQELIKAIVSKEVDLLTPLIEADQEIYNDAACPRCGGGITKERDLNRDMKLLEDGSIVSTSTRPIPRYLCRCLECRCLFDPFSGLLLEMGNLGEVRPPSIPILSTK